MVESEAKANAWVGLDTAIEAFERGFDEYQTQLHAWSQDRRKQVGRERARTEEYTAATARELEEHAQQLARDQEALAQDKAEMVRLRAELDALTAECDRRERELGEREGSLHRKSSSHEATAASLQEREEQLNRLQCELQGRFEKSQQDLEERKSALAAAEKKGKEQREQLDNDYQELARFRDDLTRREHELASQSASNDGTRQKLAQISAELDARRRNLEGEDDGLATRYSQIECRAAELASLESQLQTRIAEIDARARALDDDEGRLKKCFGELAEREREREQAAAKLAKEAAEHLATSQRVEQRERLLADATRDLSLGEERLEESRRGIEAQQQAIQAASHEHQQYERELAETQRILAERQAALEGADGQLRADQQALKAKRDELAATRDSVEAESAKMRQESARKETELLARQDQAERDQKSVEQRAQSLDRQIEELERRSKALAGREGELNGQQAKLEAAMQSLRNDRNAVENARIAITEVDESRWTELNRLRVEFNAMQRENELARARGRELEGMLGEAQAANARAIHAGEDARETARRLAEELENERRVAAEQRAAIERREREVLALLEEVEANSAASKVNPSDDATLLVQRQKSHVAVATFWADFNPAPSTVRPNAEIPPATKTIVADITAADSQSASCQESRGQAFATKVVVDTQISAMRTALAVAQAEVEAAKRDEPAAARSGAKTKTPSGGRKRKAGSAPVLFTRGMAQKSATELVAKEPAAVSASVDLDPEMANRLRMMRRLNPTKPDHELLAKIAVEENNRAKVKQKKGWFALK